MSVDEISKRVHRVHRSTARYMPHVVHCPHCGRTEQVAPEEYLRPRSEVFNMAYERPDNQLELGQQLVEAYHVNTEKLPQCWTCHR